MSNHRQSVRSVPNMKAAILAPYGTFSEIGRNLEPFQDYQTKLKHAQQIQAEQSNKGTFWSVHVHFNSFQYICLNSHKFNIFDAIWTFSCQNKHHLLNFKFQPIVSHTVYCDCIWANLVPYFFIIFAIFVYGKMPITQQIITAVTWNLHRRCILNAYCIKILTLYLY